MRIGVDEAGKGPVLGSMFAAAVRADPAALPDGVADSKTLSPQRRDTLAAELRERAAAVGLAEIPVARIDDRETDMNGLTVEAQARALGAVVQGEPVPITLDAGEVDASRFGERVRAEVQPAGRLTARHRADASDPLVAAASILAKVARDEHVKGLADRFGEVGSGYPSDPATREFLREYVRDHGTIPPCARSSWQTCEDVLAAAEQSALGEF